jgi:hypothetical protein
MPPTARGVGERLLASIEIEPGPLGHWVWQRSRNRSGYGMFARSTGVAQLAHRAMWEAMRGPIPEGLVVDHVCGRRDCVRLEHLRLCTRAENSARRFSKTCGRGHSRTAENTLVGPNGRRRCRPCSREQDRRRRGRAPELKIKPSWINPPQRDGGYFMLPMPPCPQCSGLLEDRGVATSGGELEGGYSHETGPAASRLARCLSCGGRFRADLTVDAEWEPWVWPFVSYFQDR